MKTTYLWLFLVLTGPSFMLGCSDPVAAPAPATEDEIEAYKQEAYGAEAEMQEDEQENL